MTETIQIIITESGARRVAGNIGDIGHAASGTERLLKLLEGTLGALGIAATVRELVNAADAFTNLQNKIRLVTRDSDQMSVVNDRLLDIANQTRGSLDATVTAYSRLARQINTLGISQNDALNFTKHLNEAIAVSGATATEAQNGIIQLSQGMAAGTLRGQDLRAVLEDIPEVGQTIADGMGVPIGKLRQLGTEGKISAKAIIDAFEKMGESLDRRFATTIPTVNQALVVLNNNWEVFIGKLSTSLGASNALASGIMFLARNLDTIAKVLEIVVITIGVNLALEAIPAAIRAVQALTVAIASNPLGALLTILTAVITALALFSDQIGVAEEGFITLHDLGVAAMGHLRILAHTLAEGFGRAWSYILETGHALFGDLVEISTSFPMAMLKALDFLLTRFLSFSAGIVAVWRQAMDNLKGYTGITLKEAFSTAFEKSMETLNTGGKGPLERGLDKLLEEARQVAAERVELDRLAKLKKEKATASLDVKGTLKPGEEPKFKKSFGSELEELRKQGILLTLSTNARIAQNNVMQIEEHLKRNLTEAEKQQVLAVTRTNIALKNRADALDTLGEPQRQYNEQVAAFNAIMRDTPALTEAVTEQLAKMELQMLQSQSNTGGIGGVGEAYIRQLRIMQLETRNAVADMGATFAKLFGPGGMLVQGIGDAVAQSIIFGERFDQAIKHVAQSVLSNLISSLVQVGINMALNAALGNSLQAAAAATSVATASAVTAAWGPAATLVNAATFGAGAAAGTTGLAASLATIKGLATVSGFAQGGYTGGAGRSTVAGVVHGQEYVLNAAATRRLGVGNLDRLNAGAGLGGGVNVTVINRDIPGAHFQVNQLSHGDVEVIAHQVVRKEAPNIISQDLANPSSRTSRALSTHTTATRKRNT